jgi:hypothetical protein
MNKLTKQWFDEVNQDAQAASREQDGPKVYFKKTPSGDKKTSESKNVAYHNLNQMSVGATSNILLDSTDQESDEDEEQVVIDKTQLLKK